MSRSVDMGDRDQIVYGVIRCVARVLGIADDVPVGETGIDEAAEMSELGLQNEIGRLVVEIETGMRIHLADGIETRIVTVHDLVEAAGCSRPYANASVA